MLDTTQHERGKFLSRKKYASFMLVLATLVRKREPLPRVMSRPDAGFSGPKSSYFGWPMATSTAPSKGLRTSKRHAATKTDREPAHDSSLLAASTLLGEKDAT